ncbi:MAG: hypothetical protein FJ091_13255 [Deltaproteobacteria bacterium]|nr:hypothetical protein [Deltaproteobacteria bacterium]
MSTGYRTQSPDTSREAEERQIAHWRALSDPEKARVLGEMMRAAEQLARAGVESRHPGATGEEVRLRLLALRLDRETMIRHFGWDPEREGY